MNRLFELVLLLIENEKMTTKEISEHFEISHRTVLRDIDKLLVAGIPIETKQGYGGGVSIDKSFQFNVDFMTSQEKDAIISGLQAIDSVQQNTVLPLIIKKLFPEHNEHNSFIDIDLSSWYGTSLTEKIELIKSALLSKKKLSFTYYSHNGTTHKIVSPYQIVFYWGNWYLRGICEENSDFRLYKLNRMDELNILEEEAIQKEYHPKESYFEQEEYFLKAKFDKAVEFKLIDTYGIGSFEERDNKLYFEKGFANKDFMMAWLLSFGADVEVIEPLAIRIELQKIIAKMNLIYEHDK